MTSIWDKPLKTSEHGKYSLFYPFLAIKAYRKGIPLFYRIFLVKNHWFLHGNPLCNYLRIQFLHPKLTSVWLLQKIQAPRVFGVERRYAPLGVAEVHTFTGKLSRGRENSGKRSKNTNEFFCYNIWRIVSSPIVWSEI